MQCGISGRVLCGLELRLRGLKYDEKAGSVRLWDDAVRGLY